MKPQVTSDEFWQYHVSASLLPKTVIVIMIMQQVMNPGSESLIFDSDNSLPEFRWKVCATCGAG